VKRSLCFLLYAVLILCFILAGASTVPADAQPAPEHERLLVPVVLPPSGVEGANGALWVTRFWLRNNASQPVIVYPFDYGCRFGPCPPQPPLQPGGTFWPQVAGAGPARGLFLLVEKGFLDKVKVGVRTFDTSREAKSWGTELPVVRESEFTRDELLMFDVPIDPRFRSALRIYAGSRESGLAARVRFYRLDPLRTLPPGVPDPVIGEQVVTLAPPGEGFSDAYPSSAFLDVESLLGSAGVERVTISVRPVSDVPMWAFVSVTNNQTQEITTISPQP
jgi:hypothetical protein